MDKSSFLNHKLLSKANIALLCFCVMFAGFLVSRGALSVAVIVFGVSCLRDVHPRRWLAQKWWLLGVAWVACFIISRFWSQDLVYWGERVEIKLPILLLPLAFAYLPAFTEKQLRIFTSVISGILWLSIGYTLGKVLQDPEFYISEYYKSSVMPVLAEQDYIRYSLIISLFTVWCVYIWPRLRHKGLKWFIGISVGLFIAFLHFLAVRTGLVTLYIFLLGWALYAGMKKGRMYAAVMVIAILIFMFAATRFVPTLKDRINYIFYSFKMFQEGDRSGNYSDIGRFMSYDVAGTIIKKHPVAGVGAGDVLQEMRGTYHQLYPDVPDERILLPHNQFLVVMMAAGFPCLMLFIAWLVAPLRHVRRNRKSFFFVCVWLMLALSLLIEPMLEVQYGVFVYLFFLLWQRHALIHDPEELQNKTTL